MGIVSFGKIGQGIALRAKAFGVSILAYDPYQQEEIITAHGAQRVSKDELVRRSNIIMMQVPMTAETRHFLSSNEFAAMQRGVIIVNTGRGPTIDNKALYAALCSGTVAGAGLDDPEEEPAKRAQWSPAENPLFSLPNVIVTPHSAYYSEQSIRLARETAATEVLRVLAGQRPVYPVNNVRLVDGDMSIS
jgi:D-3-phosphoglycerate dehydrogenase